jgi:hypothetical protein
MLEVVADALRSKSRRFIQDGFYRNDDGEWGYYVTVWDSGHYHMISVSHISETPALDKIAFALESPQRFVKVDGRYPNRRGHLGYWATVKSEGRWYMLSVSDMLQPFHKQWWADRG